MANDTLIAVDLAKVEFHMVTSTRADKGRRIRRTACLELMAQHPIATVIMEALRHLP